MYFINEKYISCILKNQSFWDWYNSEQLKARDEAFEKLRKYIKQLLKERRD